MNLVIRDVFPTDCSPRKTSLYLRRVGVLVLVALVLLEGVFDSSMSSCGRVCQEGKWKDDTRE